MMDGKCWRIVLNQKDEWCTATGCAACQAAGYTEGNIKGATMEAFTDDEIKKLKWLVNNLLDRELVNCLLGLKSQQQAKPAAKRFVKPSIEEVEAYIRELGGGFSAQEFYDFYESKGWVVGKSPMKDWRAAVRTWQKRKPPAPQKPADPRRRCTCGNLALPHIRDKNICAICYAKAMQAEASQNSPSISFKEYINGVLAHKNACASSQQTAGCNPGSRAEC
ncbi:MAG TPA: hypothetical protein PLR31_11565 [Anaerohalosphaeraceae bacterium]|nr:hypothetical protein [Anaerohalosphaeraceae bacterium]HPB94170.1 hypothetical protein [Anaerohalosphaeraceae bacterium]